MGVEIRAAFDCAFFGCCERAEEGGDVVFDRLWVVAGEVDGVGEPAFVEVPGALDCLGISGAVG
jgi:hypothetical protein